MAKLRPCTTRDCPARDALELIADKWSLITLSLLSEQTLRFSELRRMIEGITQKMLTQTLRALERNGVVERVVYAEVPPRVEYSLTPLGTSLTEVVRAMRTWAETYGPRVTAARGRFDARVKPALRV